MLNTIMRTYAPFPIGNKSKISSAEHKDSLNFKKFKLTSYPFAYIRFGPGEIVRNLHDPGLQSVTMCPLRSQKIPSSLRHEAAKSAGHHNFIGQINSA